MRKTFWETFLNDPLLKRWRATLPGREAELAAIREIAASTKSWQAAVGAITAAGLGVKDPKDINSKHVIGDKVPSGAGASWRATRELSMLWAFESNGAKIFKIAREFGEQLSKVNLRLSTQYVPDCEPICIEFPESIRFFDSNNNDYFHCAIVIAETNSMGAIDFQGVEPKKIVQMFFPCYREDGTPKWETNLLTLTFRENEEIDAAIERAKECSSHPLSSPDAAIYVMKALVYIDSGDPDLRQYRAPRAETKNPKKLRRFMKEHADHSLVDMTLVGFSFKKPRTYLVNEVAVTGHFRWQPYGTHRDKVKLIWIEPHVRHYGSQEKTDENHES